MEFIRRIEFLQHLAPWHMEEASRAGVWRPAWTAVPNFIDTEKFTPAGFNLRAELGIPREALVVLTAAAIKRAHKRIDHLLDEFSRLRTMQPDLPVWLIVAGGWEAETDELVRLGTERLGSRVRFLVRFPRERMPDLYRTADVFVLCSLKEMMPIALLEATASGLPCLVHQYPVMEWMIGPGGEGIDMGTPGALAAAIGALASNAPCRLSTGSAARAHCVAHFGEQAVLEQLLAYYSFVMRSGRELTMERNPPPRMRRVVSQLSRD